MILADITSKLKCLLIQISSYTFNCILQTNLLSIMFENAENWSKSKYRLRDRWVIKWI